MKNRAQMLMLWVMVALIAPIVSADMYYETTVTGQPGQSGPSINRTYMSENGMRMEMDTTGIMIINYKDEVFIEADPKAKTYSITKFEDFMKPQEDDDPEAAAMMEKMMEQMMSSMEVTKTDETAEINGYKCTKYVVTIMGMPSDYWVTKDISEYNSLVAQTEKFKDVFSKNPTMKSIASSFDMMKKVEGFPVKTVNKMMGMEIVSETTKVETKKLDASLFQPPKDFAKVDKKKI